MWIQLLLLLGIVATVIPLTRSAGARHQAIRRLLLGGFVLLAVFAVLFPSVLTSVANVLGVGRGTDLLLYILVGQLVPRLRPEQFVTFGWVGLLPLSLVNIFVTGWWLL